MTITHLFIILLIQLYFILLPGFSWKKIFPKIGLDEKKALIPFINTYEILKLKATPKYWFYLQFIPIIGWFASINILLDFIKYLGKFSFKDSLITFLCPAFSFYQYANDKNLELKTTAEVLQYKKSKVRDWIDAILYAGIFAHLVKLFIFEAYVIPTPSMEKSLMVGDYLFVTKFNYGVRLPNTPLSLPFVQHTMPFSSTAKSFSEAIKIPYIRWFSSKVNRGDAIVFNFPVGDTVINKDEFQSAITYYQVIREIGREQFYNRSDEFPIVVRPTDKKENFIKRCVGIAGDTLQVKEGQIYINGTLNTFPKKAQMCYWVETSENIFTDSYLQDSLLLNQGDINELQIEKVTRLNLTEEGLNALKRNPKVLKITLNETSTSKDLFPYNEHINPHWTENNYGPIWIPKKGTTITITKQNYDLYERIINVYEKNSITINADSTFSINGKNTNQYTFQMDYFWMMGDNRHNSLDSRYWGFVPEDHIVGKPLLIWFSKNNEGIQWKRIFNLID